MRHRDRHERVLVAEIGRREVDAPGNRFGEPEVTGEVGAATDRDGRARQAELLAAVAVEPEDLADRRHLVQQLGVIGAALLDGHDAGAGYPADLPFQLGDRLLDPPRGGVGLFAHRVGQRGPGRPVADPGFHRAVDGEHEHHQADQRDHVFGEQAPAEKPDFVVPDHPDPRAPSFVKVLRAAGPCLAQFGGPRPGVCPRG